MDRTGSLSEEQPRKYKTMALIFLCTGIHKDEAHLEQAMKAQRGRRDTALLFL